MTTITHRGYSPADPSLRNYLQRIWRIPLLSNEEELALATRWREHREQQALDRLTSSHLRLVVNIAARYRGYGVPAADLISEGTVGLISAAKRFDPNHGARLATYAAWWIKAAIHEHILRSWSLVNVGTTNAQKKLFFKLRSVKAAIGASDHGEMRADEVARIATVLAVPTRDVVVMNRRMGGGDVSLNAPIGGIDDEGEQQDLLADDSDDQEAGLAHRQSAGLRRQLLSDALARLKPRERSVLIERRLAEKPRTLGELARLHDISPERVRQIELRAFYKVRKSVRSDAASSTTRRQRGFEPPAAPANIRQFALVASAGHSAGSIGAQTATDRSGPMLTSAASRFWETSEEPDASMLHSTDLGALPVRSSLSSPRMWGSIGRARGS